MKDLLFRLIPSATIAGRIEDEDGEPISWAHVTAFRSSYSNGKRTFTIRSDELHERSGRVPTCSVCLRDAISFRPRIILARRTAASMKTSITTARQPERKLRADVLSRHVRCGEGAVHHREIGRRNSLDGFHDAADCGLPREGPGHQHDSRYASMSNIRWSSSRRGEEPIQSDSMTFGPNNEVKKDGTFELQGVAPGSYTIRRR